MTSEPPYRPGKPIRGNGSVQRAADSAGAAPTAPVWARLTTEELKWSNLEAKYEASVVPAIDRLDVVDLLGSQLSASVGAAQQAIVDFDIRMTEAFGGLGLGTVRAVLMRSEASLSSQIEHIAVSARELALAEIGASNGVNARLVAANISAMEEAARLYTVDLDSVVEMQRSLLGETDVRLGVRAEQVWIGTRGSTPIGADFVPPHHNRVIANLDDLWRFANRPSVLPLAQVAVAHAQFETIHPFVDGNGRVGRALVHRMLRRSRLASHVTVPVSAGLLADPEGYVEALTDYRSGDPRPIVDLFARASQLAAGVGSEIISDLRKVRDEWSSKITARRDSVAWRIANGLVGHPAVTADLAAACYRVSTVAVRTAIAGLVRNEVLEKASMGRRNQVWVAPDVTSCYDRIAVLIGRRRPY